MVNGTDGSGETNVCGAHASTMPHGAASWGTLLQMAEGDELYAKGHGGPSGSLYYSISNLQDLASEIC